MKRRELLGVTGFISSSGLLFYLSQTETSDKRTTSCNKTVAYNSTNKLLAGQVLSRDLTISSVKPVISIEAESDNNQTIRMVLKDNSDSVIYEDTGKTISYSEDLTDVESSSLQIFNTGEKTEIVEKMIGDPKQKTLEPNSELSILVGSTEDIPIKYSASSNDSIELLVSIEDKDGNVLQEDTLYDSTESTYTPETSSELLFKFTNKSDTESTLDFTFKNLIELDSPTNVSLSIIRSNGNCTEAELQAKQDQN